MTREGAIDLARRIARRHNRTAFVYVDQRGPGFGVVARHWFDLLDWEQAGTVAIVLPDGREFVPAE